MTQHLASVAFNLPLSLFLLFRLFLLLNQTLYVLWEVLHG